MRASLGLLTLLMSFFASAEVVVPIDSVENHVNVRMSADATSEIVGRLRQGESMQFIETTDGWHKVEIAGGATGFVSADWSLVVLEESTAAETNEDSTEVPAENLADQTIAESASERANDEPLEEIRIDFAAMKRFSEIVDIEAAEQLEPVVASGGTAAPVGPQGPQGEAGPPGPPGAATVEGSVGFLMKFSAPTIGANSQVYDDGINVGINTTEPKQRLDVNGNIQIHDRNSNVAGLMISQADGDTGYIMHNRANTLTIGAGSIDRITIDRDGNIGFSVDRPEHPIQMPSGAYVSAGGVWTNSSSRSRKENIDELTPEEALQALAQLTPVEFNYKNDQKEKYVGFIAEDVPDLVASEDRKSISTMDIVAVLTKVVQEQQIKIAELEARLDQR